MNRHKKTLKVFIPFLWVVWIVLILSLGYGYDMEYVIYATTSIGFLMVWDIWRKQA